MASSLRVLISAGEPSGDHHAAALLREMRESRPDLVAEGVGGPHLAALGCGLLGRIESLSAIGLIEPVIRALPHLVLLRALRRRLAQGRYDLAILVDYPGFNLRLAQAAASAGIPVLYYIAPQTWAWAGGRTETMRRTVRALAAILPFEEQFFSSRGVNARYVGHPLLDLASPGRTAARAALAIDQGAQLLALLPGSRPAEVRRLWPRLRDAARLVRAAHPGLEVAVAAVRGCTYPESDPVLVHWDASTTVLAAADAALCKCGTATLEAALAGVPHVLSYALHPASFAVAKRAVRLPFVGLVNILAGRRVVPELIQREARPERIAEAVRPLLEAESAAAREQRAAFGEVRARLGPAGAARRAAAMALELVA